MERRELKYCRFHQSGVLCVAKRCAAVGFSLLPSAFKKFAAKKVRGCVLLTNNDVKSLAEGEGF